MQPKKFFHELLKFFQPQKFSTVKLLHYTTVCCIASQMMTLTRLLPFMIGRYVEIDDRHWECFLQLWDIRSITCAFEVTHTDVVHLSWLVEAYL